MKEFQKYIVVLLLLLIGVKTSAQANVQVTVVTNVATFDCECSGENFVYKDTFLMADKKSVVLFPIVDFDCPKKLMEKDLQELFEARNFPYAKLTVNKVFTNASTTQSSIKFTLTLKDVSNQYTVPLQEKYINGENYIKGNQPILLTDFGIEPPTKMLGMVKVADEVMISFTIPEKAILSN